MSTAADMCVELAIVEALGIPRRFLGERCTRFPRDLTGPATLADDEQAYPGRPTIGRGSLPALVLSNSL